MGDSGIEAKKVNLHPNLDNHEYMVERVTRATGWSVGEIYFNGKTVKNKHAMICHNAAERDVPIVVVASDETYDHQKWHIHTFADKECCVMS